MIPAFTASNADFPNATRTVDTATLESGVDKISEDGVDVIATRGSFG